MLQQPHSIALGETAQLFDSDKLEAFFNPERCPEEVSLLQDSLIAGP